METLHLYNHWHYGDIFTSRCLIKTLIQKYKIIFYHNLNVPLLNDIEGLVEIKGIPDNFDMHSSDLENNIINAWIGQDKMYYFHRFETGCSLKNYLSFINKVEDYYQIPNKDYEYYFPEVHYEKILRKDEIRSMLMEFKKIFTKIVLICNGDVHSGQSSNFDFVPIVISLSQNNPNTLFILTEKNTIDLPNVKFTSDITLLSPDLLQITLISTFCDVIVGRASGPYSYSLVKENILNENIKFLCFNNNEVEANYYGNLGFNLDWYSNYHNSFVSKTIEDVIKDKK